MITLVDLNLEELRRATLTQIKTSIKNKIDSMTKKQLIILILGVRNIDDVENLIFTKRVELKEDARGQLLEIDVTEDVLGNKVKTTKREYSYYGNDPKSPIRFIRTRHYDANDKELIGQGSEIEHLSGGEVILRSI